VHICGAMGGYIHFNGEIINADEKVVGARNRGLRYGDGVFETILVINGKMRLESYHFDRLFHGLKTLQFDLPAFFTPAYLSASILALCRRNYMEPLARIRLNVFRGNGSIFVIEDNNPCVIIESDLMPDDYAGFNEKGTVIDIYKEVKKSCDILSNLKSNNFLAYTMAARHAKSNQLDDCLLLNSYDRICDSTVANIFWVKNNQVFTPPLSEGCVAGVMRRYLIEKIQSSGYAMEEMICPKQKLLEADEIFLTNALFGIRWVQQLRDKTYTNKLSAQFYKQFIKTL
jgi:branched-chain amino acid aminotransferase